MALVAALALAPVPPVEDVPADTMPALTIAGFAIAMRPIMGTYGGWNTAVYLGEEVVRPEKNIARSIFGGGWRRSRRFTWRLTLR